MRNVIIIIYINIKEVLGMKYYYYFLNYLISRLHKSTKIK